MIVPYDPICDLHRDPQDKPSARRCDHLNGLTQGALINRIRERPDIVRNKDWAHRSR